MRTASLVLGIIGGALAVIFAIVFIFVGIGVQTALDAIGDDGIKIDRVLIGLDEDNMHFGSNVDLDIPVRGVGRIIRNFTWIPAIFSLVAAVLGFIGASLVRKKNVTAGVLMIIAAIPALSTGIGFLATVLFILGGIFALVPDKRSATPGDPEEPLAIEFDKP